MRSRTASRGARRSITAIIGTAGDRPDDSLRGIGRIAAGAAQRVAIKETSAYLRGRPREQVVALLREGVAEGGMDPATVPVYESEALALEMELTGPGAAATDGAGADTPQVVVLFCHQDREGVFALLDRLDARPVNVTTELDGVASALADRASPRPATGP